MVPTWVRGREGLDLRPVRERCRCWGWAIERHATVASKPTSSWSRLRRPDVRAGAVKPDRPVQRAVHQLRPDRALPADGPPNEAPGAVAMLFRAVGPLGMRTPHTGSTAYEPRSGRSPPLRFRWRTPRFHRMQARGGGSCPPGDGGPLRTRLAVPQCRGRNRGREFPDEVVLFGGHFDSWDIGIGAIDDGGG